MLIGSPVQGSAWRVTVQLVVLSDRILISRESNYIRAYFQYLISLPKNKENKKKLAEK